MTYEGRGIECMQPVSVAGLGSYRTFNMGSNDAASSEGATREAAKLAFVRALRAFRLTPPVQWTLREVVKALNNPERLERVVVIHRVVDELASRFWATHGVDGSLNSVE